MKFDTNLKPQDKRTIGIVVFVAIVALFCWYLIRPAWIRLGDLDDKIKQAELTRQENRLKTINLASAEVLYDSSVKAITEGTTDFYDVMDNSEIEKMGTAYILKHGLTPVDFTIDLRDGSAVAEVPYQYSGIKAPSDSESNKTSTSMATPTPKPAGKTVKNPATSALDVQSLQVYYNEAVNGVKSTTAAEIQCAKITIVVQGTRGRCQGMIDQLTKNPSIRVRGFSWSDAEPVYTVDKDGNKTLVNADCKELRIDLNFYMADKPHFEE